MSKFFTAVDRIGRFIHVRGYENGKRFTEKVEYQPTLFVPTTENTGYVDIYGKSQLPITFDTMYDATKFIKSTSEVSNGVVNGMDNFTLSFISDYYGNQTPDTTKVRFKIVDIEVHSATYTDPNDLSTGRSDGFPHPDVAKWPIDAITLYDNLDDIYTVYSLRKWNKLKSTLSEEILSKIRYTHFTSERDMLIAFLQEWRECPPDILTGWYSNSFDIPYIANRLTNLFGEDVSNGLSPYDIKEIKSMQDNQNGQRDIVKYLGVAQLDYIELYKKFVLEPRSSHRLGDIAKIEVNDTKIEFEGSLVLLANGQHDPEDGVAYTQDYMRLAVLRKRLKGKLKAK